MFDFAEESDYISKNPMRKVKKALILSNCVPARVKLDSERVLNRAELRALKKALAEHEKKNPYYLADLAIELALLTGMRVGEIVVLKWSCIDDMYIRIHESEHRNDYKDKPSTINIGSTKTGKTRFFPITKEIRDLLKRIKDIWVYNEDGFLFTDTDKKRLTERALCSAATRRFNEAGISPGNIHRIRRTVSSMLNQLLPQKTVSELLGHNEITNETYYNFSTADMAEKRTALCSLYEAMNDCKTA